MLAGVVAATLLGSSLAAGAPTSRSLGESAPGRIAQVRWSGGTEPAHVPPPAAGRTAQSATFQVTYDAGFDANPAAKTSFQAAVDVWRSQLTGSVPVTVSATFSSLPTGLLGEGGPSRFYKNFTNAPVANTFYPVALASELAGQNLNTARGLSNAMIDANFSSNATWYFGTDGNTPSSQIDFESVVLHELGHGLGFIGGGEYDGVTPTIGIQDTANGYLPTIYDRFVADGLNEQPYLLTANPALVLSIFTGNNLLWTGSNGLSGGSGHKPRLYAPSVWQEGSSYSHLDEAAYPAGNANSLMTPSVGRGESVHDPGPIARGIFADMGWTLALAGPTPTPSATATPAGPVPTPFGRRAFAPSAPRNRAP